MQTLSQNKVKKYPLARLEFDQVNMILFFRVNQDQFIDEDEMKEMLGYAEEFVGPVRHYALVDFGGSLSSTSEARKMYSEAPFILQYRIADAFLVNSLSVRMVANFFIKVTRPATPTRIFNTEAKAIEWLKQLKEKDRV